MNETIDKRKYAALWRSKNRDKWASYSKKWRLNNKEHVKEYSRKYELIRKESRRISGKIWRAANREKVKEKNRIWFIKKAGYWKEYAKNNPLVQINSAHKRRAKMETTDISYKWLRELFKENNLCKLCGIEMHGNGMEMTGKTLDHIIPLCMNGTHTKDNVRVICRKCNLTRPKDGSDNICQ